MKVWPLAVLSILVGMFAAIATSPAQPGSSGFIPKSTTPAPFILGKTEQYQRAATYAQKQGGDAILILKKDEVVLEQYSASYSASKPHALASGTKSFAGVMAVSAAQDDLLKLDEPVSKTIKEWRSDWQKSKITIRQLLNLSSGIAPGKLGQVPTYIQAVKAPLLHPPGDYFQYGPTPFQVFGELMRRKLAPRKEDPLTYLKRSILNPIGLKVADWKRGSDGYPNLPSGASLTAREWAKFGQLLEHQGRWGDEEVLDRSFLKQIFKGSEINESYGLGIWLNALGPSPNGKPQNLLSAAPKDAFMAAGALDQRLYVIPSRDLVIVRFGNSNAFEDNTFLTILFSEE
jgi:CubicO group peptidase (beta-lactamase class C family)